MQHGILHGPSSNRFLFAGDMRGDLKAPDANESISIRYHHTELQPLQEWVSDDGSKLTRCTYLGLASSVCKDAQLPVGMPYGRKGSQGTPKGVVAKGPITIVVALGSIDRKES